MVSKLASVIADSDRRAHDFLHNAAAPAASSDDRLPVHRHTHANLERQSRHAPMQLPMLLALSHSTCCFLRSCIRAKGALLPIDRGNGFKPNQSHRGLNKRSTVLLCPQINDLCICFDCFHCSVQSLVQQLDRKLHKEATAQAQFQSGSGREHLPSRFISDMFFPGRC